MRNILLALAFLVTVATQAQKGKPNNLTPADKTQKFMTRWAKELKLTQEQQDKANPIVLNMFTKIAALKADTVASREVINKAIISTRKSAIESFKAILTAEQLAAFNQKLQAMKTKRDAKKGGKKKGKGKNGNQDMKKAAQDAAEGDELF